MKIWRAMQIENPPKKADAVEPASAKLRELENFRDSVSHMIVEDMKDPLTVVQATLAYILEEAEENGGYLTAKMQNAIKNAQLNSRKQMCLVSDLLDFIHLDLGELVLKKSKVNLKALMQEVVGGFAPHFQRQGVGLEIALDPQASVPETWADPHVLWRVISNLLLNSLKFTKNGCKVTVRVYQTQPRWVHFSIEDNGLKIAPTQLEHIFDKFYRGDPFGRVRKGAGFALAFCRLAIQAHGGDIWAEHTAQNTNRFVFMLPALD